MRSLALRRHPIFWPQILFQLAVRPPIFSQRRAIRAKCFAAGKYPIQIIHGGSETFCSKLHCFSKVVIHLLTLDSPYRRNSQKPPDDLYAAFKLSYPTVGPGTNGQISSAIPDDAIVATSGPRSDPIMDHRCDGFSFIFERLGVHSVSFCCCDYALS